MDFERSIESRLENGSKRVQVIKVKEKIASFQAGRLFDEACKFLEKQQIERDSRLSFRRKTPIPMAKRNLTWRKVIQLPGEKVTRQLLFGVASKLIKT